ncbi:hypothetical protein N8071_01085 [bacterium]|nr:hypothetical protein [bacterium]
MNSTADFIKNIVDGETVKAPLFSISYATEIEGHRGQIKHNIFNIIYSELDALLARHLYATRNLRFPTVEVVSTFTLKGSERVAAQSTSHAPTIVDALATIGESATKGREAVTFTVDFGGGGDMESMHELALAADYFDTMRRTLHILATVADSTFCRISGDLDGATMFLPGAADKVFFEVDFKAALLTMPPMGVSFPEPVRIAVYSFERERTETPALRARLRTVRDMMLTARKDAVDSFCQIAEHEITEFDRSMDRKTLSGFRHEIAMDLVGRLKMAFGDALKGLSPHARLLAFDWANSKPEDDPNAITDQVMAAE